jgi:fatty acid desaturase
MANGMAAGDIIGLPDREADVITAQRWARFWFTTFGCCLGVSGLAGASATRIYEDASRLSRFIARLVVAITVSCVLAALIGWGTISIAAASRHSVIR